MATSVSHASNGLIAIDGVPTRPVAIDVISTPSGKWPVYDLGKVSDGRAYLFNYEARSDWYSICIVRMPDGDGTIDERVYRAEIYGRAVRISALPGSMKCADNGEPVKPSIDRLAAAVAGGRVLPYSLKAFSGFPGPRDRNKKSDSSDIYRPDRIYGRSASNNAIGTVVGSAGESGSSRGFLSEDDARMIAAALDGDSKAFSAAAARGRVAVLYGLSLPNLVIWSPRHHQMRDPQLPLPGDRAYANEGREPGQDHYGNEGEWTAPADYPYLAEIGAEAGKTYAHKRDEAHLFNHGYAYWLATGDPRAALLQQAIMAYALASNYQRSPGVYRPRFSYQRTTLNQFSAMWKLRDVSRNLLSKSGTMFWPQTRTTKMNIDLWKGWKTSLARLDKSQSPFDRSVSIFRGIDSNSDSAYSNFMIQAYGPEAAYLWASAGEPSLMRRIAENFVLRFGYIGGARGFYGAGEGSGFPILDAEAMPYRDTASFVAWVNKTSPHPSESFDDAPAHYVLRGYWSLRMARDAANKGFMPAVPGTDQAIAKTEASCVRTARWKHAGIMGYKHAAITFP